MDYCLIKDGVVINVIVSDDSFAQTYSAANGITAVARGNKAAGIGCKYHDNTFWADVPDLDADGNPLSTTHEAEVPTITNPPV